MGSFADYRRLDLELAISERLSFLLLSTKSESLYIERYVCQAGQLSLAQPISSQPFFSLALSLKVFPLYIG